jgi:hypothetical protein
VYEPAVQGRGAGCMLKGGLRVEGSGRGVESAESLGLWVQGAGCRFSGWMVSWKYQTLNHTPKPFGEGWYFRGRKRGAERPQHFVPTLKTPHGQNDGVLSQLSFKCYLPEAASAGD